MLSDLLSGNATHTNIATTHKDIMDIGYNNKDEKSIWNKAYPIKETVHDKMVTAELPIKRYGEFRRFMKDSRLPDLFGYYEEKEIPLEVVEKEMETYDRMRKDVIEQIYNVEKLIYDTFESELKQSVDPSAPCIDHTHYLDFVKQKFNLDTVVEEMQSESFRKLRNKIEHNQFPPREDWIIDKISQDTATTMITEKILKLISTEYEKIWKEVVKKTGYARG
jgi:rubrerythrin